MNLQIRYRDSKEKAEEAKAAAVAAANREVERINAGLLDFQIEKNELEAKRNSHQKELASIRGFFTGKRRGELERILAEDKEALSKNEKEIRKNEEKLETANDLLEHVHNGVFRQISEQ